MTREKEIDVEATHYNYGYYEGDRISAYCCFKDGARWADKNPNLSSLWHDASEEPENGKIILLEVVNTTPKNSEVRYFVEYVEEWVVNLMKTDGFQSRWAYIDDLLPKGG